MQQHNKSGLVMADENGKLTATVDDYHAWKPIIDHRVSTLEAQRHEDVRQVVRLEAEIGQVDRKVSRIEGGIDFLKWSIPVSITIATAIGGALVWAVGS